MSLVVAAPAPLALAQSRTVLEEVVVTAQKREEALQDVPIAISALSSSALEKQGVSNIVDLQAGQVPALKVISFAGRPNTLQLGIRGVTESDPTQLTSERPVAVYIDGVYIARGTGIDSEVFDIERMEILRGPQGTLFGRNAHGGALNIVTQKPEGEFGFKQMLEATSLDQYKARTVINTPEVAGFAASFTYLHSEANGWINNPGGQQDFNWHDKDAYRLAIQYQTESVVANYSYDNSKLDFMQNYNHLLHKPAASLNPRPVDTKRRDTAWAGTLMGEQQNDNEGHSLAIEWEINDALTFKSISSYREMTDLNSASGSGLFSFLPGGFVPNLGAGLSALYPTRAFSDSITMADTEQESWSQEFQLIGDSDRLEWQVGGLVFHEEGTFDGYNHFGWYYDGCTPDIATGYRGSCGMPIAVPFPGALQQSAAAFLPPGVSTVAHTITEVETDSIGLYAQGTWTPPILDDRMDITLGLRYSKDEKDIFRPLESGRPAAISTQANSERVDPALTISYRLTDETSIYARYASAYRGGGVSVREVTTFTPYDEEVATSAELGLKSVFWNNRARLNAAAFYTEIEDLVISVQQTDCGPIACTTANTQGVSIDGNARMSGFEMDASVVLFEGLTLSVAYSYLDWTLPPMQFEGRPRQPALNNAPRNSWMVSLDYAFAPFSFGQLDLHVDVTDSDEYCFNPFSCFQDEFADAGDIETIQGGKDNRLVNARMTLSDIPVGVGALDVALWGKNLTDEEWISFALTAPSNPLVGNNTGGTYGEPRALGVTLTYEY
jgi:iron complex outermembrane receptor protein